MTNQPLESTRVQAIWGNKILDEGFTPIPNLVLRHYRDLGIEHGEWGFLCIIMSYKHDHKNPFPYQETIADHLNVSVRQIRKWTDSLVEKGLLRVGRRKKSNTYHLGAMIYNFEPLLQRALEYANNECNLENESDDEIIVYDDPSIIQLPEDDAESMGPEVLNGGPEVRFPPELAEPEVPVDRGPEVPLMNRTRSITTTTTTTKPAHTSVNSSDDPFTKIELAMMTNMGRPYIAKCDDYTAIKRWLASDVPFDWLIDGIHRVFSTRPNATIRSFKYVSAILEDEWEKELAKQADVVPFTFNSGTKTEQKRRTKPSNLNRGAIQRDERYENFYKLFPDA